MISEAPLLALDWATAIEASPPELVRLAAANQIQIINCPIYAPPFGGRPQWDMIGDTLQRRETKKALEAEGVRIDLFEAFYIRPEAKLQLYADPLASGAWLGAEQVNFVTQDENEDRLLERCGTFC